MMSLVRGRVAVISAVVAMARRTSSIAVCWPTGQHQLVDAVCGVVGGFVLPHADDEPPCVDESLVGVPVTIDGALQLGRPPVGVVARRRGVARAPVPEAAVFVLSLIHISEPTRPY